MGGRLTVLEVDRRTRGLLFAVEVRDHIEWMRDQGFALRTMRTRLSVLVRFGRYLRARGVNPGEDIREYAEPFVRYSIRKSLRLKRTQDPERLAAEQAGSVRQFIRHMERTGRLKPATATGTLEPVFQARLDGFVQFLRHERALADTTIHCYQLYAARFLAEAQKSCASWSALTAGQIDDFLMFQSRTIGRRGMRAVCCALRAFLRFLRMEGHVLIPRLEDFPGPRAYRQEDLPRFLSRDRVRLVLESVDRTSPSGVRDYAMLLLLITYGMRAGEVAGLTLQDLEWSAQRLRLRHGKTGRTDTFPLSVPVGEAIFEYLRTVRPQASCRQVFLTLHAPVRPFQGGAPVSAVARKHLLAAGVSLPRLGAHLLRHTTAQYLLAQGFSFKTIGDYLGHSSPSSTSVYLKVDLEGLREVACNDGEDLL